MKEYKHLNHNSIKGITHLNYGHKWKSANSHVVDGVI